MLPVRADLAEKHLHQISVLNWGCVQALTDTYRNNAQLGLRGRIVPSILIVASQPSQILDTVKVLANTAFSKKNCSKSNRSQKYASPESKIILSSGAFGRAIFYSFYFFKEYALPKYLLIRVHMTSQSRDVQILEGFNLTPS